MASDKYAKTPLLYIHQPAYEEPQVTMQHQFRTSKMRKLEQKREETAPDIRTTQFFKTEGKKPEDRTGQKKFQDMTLEEQLQYLASKPNYELLVNYEIQTEEETYEGMVWKVADGIVHMKRGRLRMEIPQEKITKIRIIGF